MRFKRFAIAVVFSSFGTLLQGYPQQAAKANVPPPPSTPVPTTPLSISAEQAQGILVSAVAPLYPPEAKAKGISGTVRLKGTITKQGLLKNLEVVSSPDPILTNAALFAVRQFQYRLYLLQGNPVEVDTVINVEFKLGKSKRATKPATGDTAATQ